MKRTELEKYLGKKVEIVLFDDDRIRGVLHKTEEFKSTPDLWLKPKYYVLTVGDEILPLIFKCSHVTKIKEVNK